MKQPVLTVILLLALGTAQDPPSERGSEPPNVDRGVLAVLRRDGVMFPFASVRGRTWTAAWPGSLRNLELPINLDAVPERWWGGWRPESWQAWLNDGTTRQIRTLEPVQFRVHCEQRLGIKTDYRAAEAVPLLPTEPFPKDGIAVTAGIRVEPIEIVERSEAGWGAVAIDLLEEFDRAEDVELSVVSSAAGWKHPVPGGQRHDLPVRIESWYRTRLTSSVTASYIEAVRSYPPGPDDKGCGLETLFGGWVFHSNGKVARRPQLGARVTYCDRVNATYMLPFGRIRVRDSVYWIAQLSGHESEWYSVSRMDDDRATLVAEYFAGSRDSCR